jgi:hypothetical protein
MKRFRFAAATWLLSLLFVGLAQAQSFDVATDWATTYPTTTAQAAATSATWGPNPTYANIWGAGEFSYNWTNSTGTSGTNVQYLPTYYGTTTTGYETSGGTNVASFTYSVPFQAYAFTPGSTINQATSPSLAAQISSGFNGISGSKMTVPSSMHVTGTATTGNIQTVAHAGVAGGSASETGFTGGAFTLSGVFNDSAGSVRDLTPGVFYDYATTNATSSALAFQNTPSGSLDNVVVMSPSFGPTYISWTAPTNGYIPNIIVNVWDLHESTADNDGFGGFAVYASPTGATLGSKLFSALNQNGSTQNGSIQSYVSSTVGTTNSNIGTLSGFATTSKGYSFGVGWTASNISVTAGEVLYFVADPGHTYAGGGFHSEEGGGDPLAVQIIINGPEPSSFVLLGLASLGLAAVAVRRRRSA